MSLSLRSFVTLLYGHKFQTSICFFQGNLEVQDFDIRSEAGESFRAVVKDFTARVTENYLEIHLFWAGRGTCCVPAQGTYGPSISAISVTPAGISPVGKFDI